MRVLQVGNTDIYGKRFNGHFLHHLLRQNGIFSKHCVWRKTSKDADTFQLIDCDSRIVLRILQFVEWHFSVQSLLFPFSFKLLFNNCFLQADVVHYHLIHAANFSFLSFPFLSRLKPSVWTLHDPWAFTGHCTTPYDCEKWMSGCGNCPRIWDHFPMKNDHSAFMWQMKKTIYSLSKLDLVVASKWMFDRVRKSPLLSMFDLHFIPFGLDLNLFKPIDPTKAKQRLGVFPGSKVLCFRATDLVCKGMDFIKDCLRRLKSDYPICLLTFDQRGAIDEFRGKFQIIDLGWVDDVSFQVEALNAVDLFLMPSLSDSFGMMAMEAMACGKPVLTFEGTAIPEVIFAPEGGVTVPSGDSDALFKELSNLLKNDSRRLQLGEKALRLAQNHYNCSVHLKRMLELYKMVIQKRGKPNCG